MTFTDKYESKYLYLCSCIDSKKAFSFLKVRAIYFFQIVILHLKVFLRLQNDY